MLRKVQKDLKKEKHYIRLIILDVWIKKQPYFLIQTAQYAHFCPENVLFQSFKRKILLFFDRNHSETINPCREESISLYFCFPMAGMIYISSSGGNSKRIFYSASLSRQSSMSLRT